MSYQINIIRPLKELAGTLRLRAFDTSTADGRARERYRRAALTALASGGAKGISILTGLVTIPLTLHYLGAERYGLWMTISSAVLLMGFADLGMGNGLMNAVSEANGKDDRQAALNHVSSGFFMLSAMALLIMVAFILAYPHVPWPAVFNIQSNLAVQEAGPAVAVFMAIFALNLPLGVVQRVQMGYQEGCQASLYQALGSLFSLAAVLLVIYLQAGLPWLVLAMAGGPVLALLINGVVFFGIQHPWLWPQWRKATSGSADKILKLGILFFVLQLAFALMSTSDNLVAAQILGPEAVTQYSVPMRMFNIIPMIIGMLVFPLWPAYGEALARGEMAWMKKTLVMSLLMTFVLVAVPTLIFVLWGGQIIHFWVGPSVTPSLLLLIGLGIWTIMQACGNTLGMFMNGAAIIRFQIVCSCLVGISSLLGKIFLARSIGLPGIVWGTVISFTCFSIIPYIVFLPKKISALGLRQIAAREA